MPCGRPKKRPRTQNISGLRGQHHALSVNSDATSDDINDMTNEEPTYIAPSLNFGIEEGNNVLSDSESDADEEAEWSILVDEEFSQKLAEMVQQEEEGDLDWILDWLQRKRKKACKSHPKTYKKGPDVMSKSVWTQQQYRAYWKGQSLLDSFGFTKNAIPPLATPHVDKPSSLTPHAPVVPQVCSISMVSISDTSNESESLDSDDLHGSETGMEGMGDLDSNLITEDSSMSEMENEAWEDELMMTFMSHDTIHDWSVLREQIQQDLKKHKHLALSQINQLMILSHFATLRIRGVSRIAASLEIA
ncbi:hypothetical protein BKA82DRAFT_36334 [Pisolithus tinctorius]|nr:hypothetical protein BKA82DRAFT_4362699 [Pisolithus tinctorius]KAI6142424.1 hypothetical protein BKA82DRAFT_36334 [Pisolithus tinctorius]